MSDQFRSRDFAVNQRLARNRCGSGTFSPTQPSLRQQPRHDLLFRNSPARRAGCPIISAYLLHTLAISGLLPAAHRFFQPFVVPPCAPHPNRSRTASLRAIATLAIRRSRAFARVQKLATPSGSLAHSDLAASTGRKRSQRVACCGCAALLSAAAVQTFMTDRAHT